MMHECVNQNHGFFSNQLLLLETKIEVQKEKQTKC